MLQKFEIVWRMNPRQDSGAVHVGQAQFMPSGKQGLFDIFDPGRRLDARNRLPSVKLDRRGMQAVIWMDDNQQADFSRDTQPLASRCACSEPSQRTIS